MNWERVVVLKVSESHSETQRHHLLVASRFLRVRGLILASDQITYRRIGWLRIVTLDGDLALSKLVVQDSEIIPIPDWLTLFKIELKPMHWIYNAQVLIDQPTPDSPMFAPSSQYDYVEIPLDIQDIAP